MFSTLRFIHTKRKNGDAECPSHCLLKRLRCCPSILTESFGVNRPLSLLHAAQDRKWEMMGFYITLCTVHTTQWQVQVHGTIVFCCVHPRPCPCPCPVPGPLQCVWPITLTFLKLNVRIWSFCVSPFRTFAFDMVLFSAHHSRNSRVTPTASHEQCNPKLHSPILLVNSYLMVLYFHNSNLKLFPSLSIFYLLNVCFLLIHGKVITYIS